MKHVYSEQRPDARFSLGTGRREHQQVPADPGQGRVCARGARQPEEGVRPVPRVRPDVASVL